jgi:hypothetical protein
VEQSWGGRAVLAGAGEVDEGKGVLGLGGLAWGRRVWGLRKSWHAASYPLPPARKSMCVCALACVCVRKSRMKVCVCMCANIKGKKRGARRHVAMMGNESGRLLTSQTQLTNLPSLEPSALDLSFTYIICSSPLALQTNTPLALSSCHVHPWFQR